MKQSMLWLVFVLLVGVVIFRLVIFGDRILMTTDDNIGAVAAIANILPEGFKAAWQDAPLVGVSATRITLGLTNFFYYAFPVKFYMNAMHIICLLLASLFLFLFLRRQGLHPAACAFATVVAFWLGSNLTLVYAGHTKKFGILALSAAALYVSTYIGKRRLLVPSGIFGALAGMMFCEQQDVAIFFSMPLGAYFILCLVREQMGWGHRAGAAVMAGMMALMIASPALLSGYKTSVEGVASVSETAQQKWDFATQWSWPPEESIAFIAPGYTGWRSGEPAGPYWGRMGRSQGWEQHHQGFMNFKLENTYLGLIPVMLSLLALLWLKPLARPARDDEPLPAHGRGEVCFWAIVCTLALLLAFGKYFPLYALFHRLPGVNNIRNPNKFLQIFQVALAILSAWGLHGVVLRRDLLGRRGLAMVTIGLGGFAGFCLLWLLVRFGAGEVAALTRFGWPEAAARTISANKTIAVWHLLGIVVLLLTGFGLLRWVAQSTRWRSALAAVLVGVTALDGAWLARHYIKTMPRSWIAENTVTATLKKELGENRVATLSQDGFYNLWLTYLLPYHGIRAFNFTQMPRMPEEYKLLLAAFRSDPLRLWQVGGVGAVMLPQEAYAQITSQAAGRQLLEQRLAFDVSGTADNEIRTVASLQGRHVLAFFSPAQSGRFRLVAGTRRFAAATDALAWLADSRQQLFEQVAVHDAAAPDLDGSGQGGIVRVRHLSTSVMELDVDASSLAVLRCADRFGSDWRASVDGVTAPVFRVDYCMMGVAVPQGRHTVRLEYRPSLMFLYIQLAGYMVLAGLLLLAGLQIILNRGVKNAQMDS